MALAIIAQSKAFDDAAKLGPTWASLETLQQCKAPPVGELTALHTVRGGLLPGRRGRDGVRCVLGGSNACPAFVENDAAWELLGPNLATEDELIRIGGQ